MIERELAENIKAVALDCAQRLDMSVKDAIDGAPEPLASMYRRLVGEAMGHIFMEVLTPIYLTYPDLEPESLKRARLDATPVFMPPETGARLMKACSSVAAALSNLRKDISADHEPDVEALGVALQSSVKTIQDIEEFLRRTQDR